MKHEYVECQCATPEHMLRFTWDESPDWDEIYVDVHLQYHFSFFKRLWYGIKYILGFKSRFGHFEETWLSYEEVEKIKKMCDKWLETHCKKPSTLEEELYAAQFIEKFYKRGLKQNQEKIEKIEKEIKYMTQTCKRCGLPLDEERVCSESGFTLPCVGKSK